jgi:hypothetical protein
MPEEEMRAIKAPTLIVWGYDELVARRAATRRVMGVHPAEVS